jgi:CheY-like chemotaxis protein
MVEWGWPASRCAVGHTLGATWPKGGLAVLTTGWASAPVLDMPTLLIVDDHASFCAVARAALAEGFTVVGEAVDGAGALKQARELRPDLVLLDVQLLDADGFAVAAELAVQDHPPLVVLTSSRDARDFEPLLCQSPARGFLEKERLSAGALTDLLK